MRISDWISDVCSSDLFYLQGLNTTAVHAHAALFGVYGFLALGFTLLVLHYIRPDIAFNERLMRIGFWGLNAGLVLMIFTSLLPVGLFQFEASVTTGMWYARSAEFLQQGFLETLRWIRTFGDVRSEEHTSELQSLMRISYAVFCLKKN